MDVIDIIISDKKKDAPSEDQRIPLELPKEQTQKRKTERKTEKRVIIIDI